MLAVTEAAISHLHDSLKSVADSDVEGQCFRIVPKDGVHLGLSLAEPKPGDKKYEHEGDTVLAVPAELQPGCAGRTLGVNDDGRLEIT
jgi:hypothetical protein